MRLLLRSDQAPSSPVVITAKTTGLQLNLPPLRTRAFGRRKPASLQRFRIRGRLGRRFRTWASGGAGGFVEHALAIEEASKEQDVLGALAAAGFAARPMTTEWYRGLSPATSLQI